MKNLFSRFFMCALLAGIFAVHMMTVSVSPVFASEPTILLGERKQANSTDLFEVVTASRGKVVVVNFFASWCPPCREEIPSLKALRKDFSPNDLTIVGVSVDEDYNAFATFIQKMDFSYPSMWASQELMRFFQIGSIPRLLIYDRNGKLMIDNVGLVPHHVLADAITTLME